jgi:hypothetical protein
MILIAGDLLFACKGMLVISKYVYNCISLFDEQNSADEPFSADEKFSADEQISSDELIFGFGFRPSVRPSEPKFSALVRFSVGKFSNFGRIRSPATHNLPK